jgi:hypothetical protein
VPHRAAANALGRPRRVFRRDQAVRLRSEGKSLREICRYARRSILHRDRFLPGRIALDWASTGAKSSGNQRLIKRFGPLSGVSDPPGHTGPCVCRTASCTKNPVLSAANIVGTSGLSRRAAPVREICVFRTALFITRRNQVCGSSGLNSIRESSVKSPVERLSHSKRRSTRVADSSTRVMPGCCFERLSAC